MNELKDRIKERRLALGLTLLDVANRLGVKEATVQRYESGEIKNIKHDTVLRLSQILNCTPAYLMGWDSSATAQDKLPAREGGQALQREFIRLGLIPKERDLSDKELAVLIDYFKNNAEFIKARMDQVRDPD